MDTDTDTGGHSTTSGDEFESLRPGSMVVTADEYEPEPGVIVPFITVSEVTGEEEKRGEYSCWSCVYYECVQDEKTQAAVEGKWTKARGPKAKGEVYDYQVITNFDNLLQNGKLPAVVRAAVAAEPFFLKNLHQRDSAHCSPRLSPCRPTFTTKGFQTQVLRTMRKIDCCETVASENGQNFVKIS
jgi:hypothetical protein